jgi:hypothetical protein
MSGSTIAEIRLSAVAFVANLSRNLRGDGNYNDPEAGICGRFVAAALALSHS